MDSRIKNILGIVGAIAILVGGYSALIYSNSFANSQQGISARTFSVTGDGKASAIPDIAQFTFSIITQGGTNIPSLQKENSDKSNAVIDFVKSQGVDAKDITTQNYNIEPRYESFSCPQPIFGIEISPRPCPPPKIVGYTISQTVSVKVRDFAKIGGLLAGVVEKGANSVSQLSFTVDNPDTYKNQAREEAIKKAQEKARTMAEQAGFKIGKLISIDESGIFPGPFGMGGAVAFDKAVSAAPTIEPGSQEITVNVVLRYEMR